MDGESIDQDSGVDLGEDADDPLPESQRQHEAKIDRAHKYHEEAVASLQYVVLQLLERNRMTEASYLLAVIGRISMSDNLGIDLSDNKNGETPASPD